MRKTAPTNDNRARFVRIFRKIWIIALLSLQFQDKFCLFLLHRTKICRKILTYCTLKKSRMRRKTKHIHTKRTLRKKFSGPNKLLSASGYFFSQTNRFIKLNFVSIEIAIFVWNQEIKRIVNRRNCPFETFSGCFSDSIFLPVRFLQFACVCHLERLACCKWRRTQACAEMT